jgi:hypothetical protein
MKIHINFREGVDTIDIYRVYLVVLALETAMDESAPLSASDTVQWSICGLIVVLK